MHIKRVVIEGFKSYRDRQQIPSREELVEGHCVVGECNVLIPPRAPALRAEALGLLLMLIPHRSLLAPPHPPSLADAVGRNGSGKSNFFDAIMFVLSDRNTRLTKLQKQKLIHDVSIIATPPPPLPATSHGSL
tara:strand:- start:422 stop:820 length:399 start_codon:yes stop_codon:yes gene_type:complete